MKTKNDDDLLKELHQQISIEQHEPYHWKTGGKMTNPTFNMLHTFQCYSVPFQYPFHRFHLHYDYKKNWGNLSCHWKYLLFPGTLIIQIWQKHVNSSKWSSIPIQNRSTEEGLRGKKLKSFWSIDPKYGDEERVMNN